VLGELRQGCRPNSVSRREIALRLHLRFVGEEDRGVVFCRDLQRWRGDAVRVSGERGEGKENARENVQDAGLIQRDL